MLCRTRSSRLELVEHPNWISVRAKIRAHIASSVEQLLCSSLKQLFADFDEQFARDLESACALVDLVRSRTLSHRSPFFICISIHYY